jgi:hypothetical protein
MLSEETAVGDYPFDCIATMKTVADAIGERMAGEQEAVILAAGPSTGFGSLTTNKHKCMLDVGGTTIIEHQIENLMLAGIPSRSVCVVTGHHHRQIEHYPRSGHADRRPLRDGRLATRGGPGIVLASLAYSVGIINQRFFVTLILTALATSLLCGVWFRSVIDRRLEPLRGRSARAAPAREAVVRP